MISESAIKTFTYSSWVIKKFLQYDEMLDFYWSKPYPLLVTSGFHVDLRMSSVNTQT